MGDQVDEIMEGLGLLSRGHIGRYKEDLALGFILIPLSPEVVDIRLGVATDLVLQARAVDMVS